MARSSIPSNSLASVYGLLADCADRKVLGPDVDIDDRRLSTSATPSSTSSASSREIKKAGGGFVGLVGVQSNQFPRAIDIARRFRAADIPVVHRRLPRQRLHLDAARAAARPEGGARPRHHALLPARPKAAWTSLLQDIDKGNPKPIYNYMNDLPELAGATFPFLPEAVTSSACSGKYASFDAGRGCPFQCSFCTIINVQGRKSRHRTRRRRRSARPRQLRRRASNRFFITDDNFARNRNWEPILDRLIELRENEKIQIKLLIQVDTMCHRIPRFIEKVARAGCNTVYIGLENINPESLMGANKRQNKIWEYRAMLQAWRKAKVMIWAGYILGFPTDTPESIRRDIEIVKRELPIDIMEFMCLTPLPGSEDHKVLYIKGVPMDPDMNKYDIEHVCTAHPRMSKEEWEQAYRDAWASFYSDEHVETILKRAHVNGLTMSKVNNALTVFGGCAHIEDVHPMQFGLGRRKVRTQRRHGMPIVNPLVFYPWRAYDFTKGLAMGFARAAPPPHAQAHPARSALGRLHRRIAARDDRGLEPAGRVHGSLRRQDPGDPRGAEEGKGKGRGRGGVIARFLGTLSCCRLRARERACATRRPHRPASAPPAILRRWRCTRAIGSGQFTGLELAKLHTNRGVELKQKGDLDGALKDYDTALTAQSE